MADFRERVVRVGVAAALDLAVVHVEARVALRGELEHREALLAGRVRVASAVIRKSGRKEDHLLEVERFRELGREPQVPEMDRVEGAAEKAEGRH